MAEIVCLLIFSVYVCVYVSGYVGVACVRTLDDHTEQLATVR